MVDRTPDHDDNGTGFAGGSPPRMPRWVKVFGIVVAILIVTVVAVMLVSGGHGPGSHMPSGH